MSLLQLPSSFHSIYAICLTNELDETGTYTLASDAALVYDTFCKQAFGDEHETNFATAQDHMRLRDAELKSKGLDVDFDEVQALIAKKVDHAVSKLNSVPQDTSRFYFYACSCPAAATLVVGHCRCC